MIVRRAGLFAATALLALGACAGETEEVEVIDAVRVLTPDEAAVLAVAETSLEAITNEDMVAFTDLMIEEAVIVPTGGDDVMISSWAAERARELPGDIVERGFDAEVQVSGRVASVWLPYDLYIDGEWSHCGVDVFTMVKEGEDWRIMSMAWSRLQPPDCDPHPDGAPS